MADFIRDRAASIEHLRMLRVELQLAEYELAAGVGVLKHAGMSWADIAEGLEVETKQAASQWAKRHNAQAIVRSLDLPEHDRIARVVGIGSRVERYQVRRHVSGRAGVSRVVWEDVSTHLSPAVARRRADELGDAGSVWQLDPDGSRRQLDPAGVAWAVRRYQDRQRSAELVDAGDAETPF